jgi:hypothetical protein
MTALLLRFPMRPRGAIRRCSSCGGHFEPRQPHHALCRSCYLWDRAITHQAIALKAFHELGRG